MEPGRSLFMYVYIYICMCILPFSFLKSVSCEESSIFASLSSDASESSLSLITVDYCINTKL